MQRNTTQLALAAALTTILLLGGATATRAQLVVDGGFEPPNPTTTPGLFQSGFVIRNVGDFFGGPSNNAWKVVQIGGGVDESDYYSAELMSFFFLLA